MLGTQPKDIIFMHRIHDGKERETHPTPIEDTGIQREVKEKTEYCGFINMVQLKLWFTDVELNMLKLHGFSIKTIIGTITAYGSYQVLFEYI